MESDTSCFCSHIGEFGSWISMKNIINIIIMGHKNQTAWLTYTLTLKRPRRGHVDPALGIFWKKMCKNFFYKPDFFNSWTFIFPRCDETLKKKFRQSACPWKKNQGSRNGIFHEKKKFFSKKFFFCFSNMINNR